jgi:hypothetical protein
MESLFEEVIILNQHKMTSVSQILEALLSFKKPNMEDKVKEFKTSMAEKQQLCLTDIQTLKVNYEMFKKKVEQQNNELATKLKDELLQKEQKIHSSMMNEIEAEYKLSTQQAQDRFSVVSKAIDNQLYFEVGQLQNQKDLEYVESKIRQLQQQLTLFRQRKEQIDQRKKQNETEQAKQDGIVQRAEQRLLQRQSDINATLFIFQTCNQLCDIITSLANEVDITTQSKIQECNTSAADVWRKCLLENVDIICSFHKLLETRLQRKIKDIQHLYETQQKIVAELQNANERENLVDVAKFQKKKSKNEEKLDASVKEQQRLQHKQTNILDTMQYALQELQVLKEERHLAKVKAITSAYNL